MNGIRELFVPRACLEAAVKEAASLPKLEINKVCGSVAFGFMNEIVTWL